MQHLIDIIVRSFLSVGMAYFVTSTDLGSYIAMKITTYIRYKFIYKLLTCPYCLSFHIFMLLSTLATDKISIQYMVSMVSIALIIAIISRKVADGM